MNYVYQLSYKPHWETDDDWFTKLGIFTNLQKINSIIDERYHPDLATKWQVTKYKLNVEKDVTELVIVHPIQCRKCKSIIYSRATHDLRFCKCKSVAIDGGLEYRKITGQPKDIKFAPPMVISATEQQLYKDWNIQKNKWGLIENVE